ncbi:MAG: SusC/RagA family TonB-linked outer membrane protein [Odoribacteraceae bacterium]|jgi:TonB-linked SusC/RagA family outer membrane protein|nr:SusC/RagA family TonB-linked outer membrane protein [Odoribacteraceae bacterium]
MKLKVMLVLLSCLPISAAVYSQDSKLSLRVENASLEEVIWNLQKKTGFVFMYGTREIEHVRGLNIDAHELTVKEILAMCLKGTGLTPEVTGDAVIIRKETPQQPGMVVVKGKVTDEKGEPLPGATVQVKGTTLGASVDVKGEFMLSLPARDDIVLSFSFMGMVKQEIAWKGETTLEVVMKEEIARIEEVVVTGYSTIRKGEYVGAITVVRGEDVYVAGETSIDQMLQGVIPGMSVITRSGQVGSSPKIRVRGTSTLLGNQEPLWVVDGVVQRDPLPVPDNDMSMSADLTEMREIASNAIAWLNPMDVETITVLKDASATAIYGSQAANGVIVITTKKARAGDIAVSYSGSYSIGQRPRYGLYDLMNSQEAMQFSKEVYLARESYTQEVMPIGYGGLIQRLHNKEISYDELITEYRKMERQNTDWFDLLFRNSFNHSHNVSISGGTEKVVSRNSFSIQGQKGEAIGNDMLTFTASSNTTFRFGDNLMLNLLLNGSVRETNGFAYGVAPFDYAYNTTRTIPMYNEDGTFFYHEKRGEGSVPVAGKFSYNYNIQNELDNTGNSNATKTLGSTIDLRWKVLPELEYQGLFSYNASSSEIKTYATELSFYITQKRGYEYGTMLPNSTEELASPLPFGGLVQIVDAMNRDYSFRNNLVYSKTFNDAHHLILQAGIEMRSATTNGNTNTRYGYLRYRGESYASVPLSYLKGTTTTPNTLHEAMRDNASIVDRKNNTLSEYLSVVYNYNERYTLNFNARLDASNRFGQDENKRFHPTWSIGGKWRIGNESLFNTATWLNTFDVSASYGYQGNAVESVSPHLIATDGGHSTLFKQYVLNIKSLPYPDLGWEETNSWNLGVDVTLWNNRLNVTANLYRKVSDVLSSREVIVENGMNSATIFGSKMTNRGYDFVVNVVPVRTKDFTWQFSVNSGLARNTITENDRVNSRDEYISGEAIVNGEAYHTFYSYAYDGLRATDGRPLFKYPKYEGVHIGDPLEEEQKTEEFLDYLVKSGTTEPDFSGGFSTMLRYKKFSARAQFAFSFGAQGRLPVFYSSAGAPTPEQNVPRLLKERWQKPGDELKTDIPSIPHGSFHRLDVPLPHPGSSPVTISPYTMYNTSDLRVADTDFIRCRNISLSYDVSTELLKKFYMKRLSVSASMSNPFLVAFDKDWRGYDPETVGWPARRTTSLSINMTF